MSEKNTRLTLIEAAEKIVAERGFSTLTMREIQLQAGQWNKNVVQYYFGNIEGIISAIVDIRMAPIDLHRRKLINSMTQEDDPAVLFNAIIVPYSAAMLKNPRGYYARFILQVFCDPNLSSIVIDNQYMQSYLELHNRLLRITDLDVITASRRLNSIIGMILFSCAHWERNGESEDKLVELVQDLIYMSAASFTAQYHETDHVGRADGQE